MLQRIQTVFLFIAGIAGLLVFFFPLADYYHELEGNYRLFITGVSSLDPNPAQHFSSLFTLPLIIMAAVAAALPLLTIVLFKKRLLQSRLCAFGVLANIVLLMLLFFYYAPQLGKMTNTEPVYHYPGIACMLVSLIMLILANRSIKKDEALVKSSDRLR